MQTNKEAWETHVEGMLWPTNPKRRQTDLDMLVKQIQPASMEQLVYSVRSCWGPHEPQQNSTDATVFSVSVVFCFTLPASLQHQPGRSDATLAPTFCSMHPASLADDIGPRSVGHRRTPTVCAGISYRHKLD